MIIITAITWQFISLITAFYFSVHASIEDIHKVICRFNFQLSDVCNIHLEGHFVIIYFQNLSLLLNNQNNKLVYAQITAKM